QVQGLSEATIACLQNYDWPGNVRELENVIERAVVLGTTSHLVPDDLPETLLESHSSSGDSGSSYHAEVARRKKELILHALEEADGNFTHAAKLLGIHPNYLHRLVRILELRTNARKSGKTA